MFISVDLKKEPIKILDIFINIYKSYKIFRIQEKEYDFKKKKLKTNTAERI